MSVIATIMSFTYSGIGLGLSIAKDTGGHSLCVAHHAALATGA